MLAIATLIAASAVLYGALCRVNYLRTKTHQSLWVCVFLGFAIGAMTALYECLDREPSWSALIMCGAAWLYLWGSRKTWRNGAPVYLEKA